MKKTLTILATVVTTTAICAGLVYAATEHNVTSDLGGTTGDFFTLDGTLSVSSLRVGAQSVGGVTFFNGTIVNNTTNAAGADNPVTFGDNVRIDGRVYRGATAGTADSIPFIVNDNMEVAGNLTVDGSITLGANQSIIFGETSTLDLTNTTITGLSSADLSDGSYLAKTNAAATLTADWINTAYPWAANEIADVTRIVPISLSGFYSDIDGSGTGPEAITTATTPNLSYTANQGLFLEYAATETEEIGTQIVVPSDYASGGVFKAVVDTSGDLVTDWNLDFQVAISETAGTAAWATSMADETAVDIPDNAGTPDVITFTPTSQSDISTGNTLFFSLWPDTNAAGEPNVEIYALWFEYTATQ